MKREYWLDYPYTVDERNLIIQRLIALWAFAESGLGGVLHALQVPFTGLIIGGIAMIIITLLVAISKNMLKDVAKAFLIVVVVKLTISPYTPITAYVAILFQSVLGLFIYKLFKINYISILFFCCIAMLESAVQKILLLVIFYGKNLFIATNDFINFILHQFSIQKINASFWILLIYLMIYFIGGLLITHITHNMIKSTLQQPTFLHFQEDVKLEHKKRSNKQPLLYLALAIILAVSIYFLNQQNSTSFKILYSLVFSFSIILFWYFILTPFVSKQLLRYLSKKEYQYKTDITSIINFFPTLQKIVKLAWQQSQVYKGLYRMNHFIKIVFSWVILHQQQPIIESEC